MSFETNGLIDLIKDINGLFYAHHHHPASQNH